MNDQQLPEMFSLALSNGNKVTIGFRRIPITEKDLARIYQYLGLLAESIVNDAMAAFSTAYESKEPEAPPVPVASASRVLGAQPPPEAMRAVLRGHIPTEVELATASERIALRENIWTTSNAMEQERLQQLHVRKVLGKSSSGSDESSQS